MAADRTDSVDGSTDPVSSNAGQTELVGGVLRLSRVLGCVRVLGEARKLKRNPYFCKICGLSAEYHTEKEYRDENNVLLSTRAMCAGDIESDLDPDLVHKVLMGIVPGDGTKRPL